jgi:hypothetical protein
MAEDVRKRTLADHEREFLGTDSGLSESLRMAENARVLYGA